MIAVEFTTTLQDPATILLSAGMVFYPCEVECEHPEHTHENKGVLDIRPPGGLVPFVSIGFINYESALQAYRKIQAAACSDEPAALIKLHELQGDFFYGTTDHIPKV